jgi:regulator of protease activity HflC (stomatin/prohibitin superfamily)
MTEYFWLLLLLIPLSIGSLILRRRSQTIIYPHQKGLLYKDGVLAKQLDAGRHFYFAPRSRIDIHDMRKFPLSVAGQEIQTQDNVGLRISLVGHYQIVDLERVVLASTNYLGEVYSITQLALRKAIGTVTVDALLADKSQLDAAILAEVVQKVGDLGVTVTDLAVLDVMLPANLKKAYSGVLEAQKEAQKNLEKARGEQAVLRSLANSSKLYQENPSLLQARVIQALSSGQNSIVFGADERTAISKTK